MFHCCLANNIMTFDDYINEIKASPDLAEGDKAKAIALLTSRAVTPSMLDEVQAIIDAAYDKEYAKVTAQRNASLRHPPESDQPIAA